MKRLRFADKVLGLFAVGLFISITFLFRLAMASCPLGTCTAGYAFAWLDSNIHSTPDIIGSKGNFSFHNVQLCNEDIYDPTNTTYFPYNHSVVWTAIVGHNSSLPGAPQFANNIWFQTGWIRMNSQTSPAFSRVYCERGKIEIIDGNETETFNRWTLGSSPPSGTKEYKAELFDKNEGIWKAYYDQNPTAWADTNSTDYWKGLVGKQCQNRGEVLKLQTDMAGINSARCTLSNLKLRKEGSSNYEDQDTQTNSSSTDETKWGHNKVSATTVEVWDIVTIPADCQ